MNLFNLKKKFKNLKYKAFLVIVSFFVLLIALALIFLYYYQLKGKTIYNELESVLSKEGSLGYSSYKFQAPAENEKENEPVEDISLCEAIIEEAINNEYHKSDQSEIDNIIKKAEKNTYNIFNGCIYKDGQSLFEKDLSVKISDGFFGDVKNSRNFVEGIYEWFRVEKDNYLYVYLVAYRGCGGCVYNGPFLKIDLKTGEVSGHNSNIPYLPNLFLSPDRLSAVEVSFDHGAKSEIELYIYDFIRDERTKLIYTMPKDKTILYDGDGTYPMDDSIKWLNDNTLEIQLYKRSEEKFEEAIAIYELKENGYSEFVGHEKADEPVIVKIN